MKNVIIFFALWALASQTLHAQYFNNMSISQQNSILVDRATETVMKYAKEYYRDYKKPGIELAIVEENESDWRRAADKGRKFYKVTFPCDTTKESFEYDYAVLVTIWADTGNVEGIYTGMGWGYYLEHNPNGYPPQIPYAVYPPRKEVREALARWQKDLEDSLVHTPTLNLLPTQRYATGVGYYKATNLDVNGVFIGGVYSKTQVQNAWGMATWYHASLSEDGLDELYDYGIDPSRSQFLFGDNGTFHTFTVATPNFVVYTAFDGGIKVGDPISRVEAIGLGTLILQSDGNYRVNSGGDLFKFYHSNGIITQIHYMSSV